MARAGPVAYVLLACLAAPWLTPPQRLVLMSAGLLYVIKAHVLLQWPLDRRSAFSPLGFLLYFSAWPGIDPEPLYAPSSGWVGGDTGWRGLRGLGPGLWLLFALARYVDVLPRELVGWAGLAGLLLTIHVGWSEVLTAAVRRQGFAVRRLFDEPWRSRSLRDFWSRRWNLAFVDMDRMVFLPPLRRLFAGSRSAPVYGIFLVSGLLHEVAISYPVLHGWGQPGLYFLIQGLAFGGERKLGVERRFSDAAARAWTWAWILVPLPLLFHQSFRNGLVVDFIWFLHGILGGVT
jgi:alginate O-acetyltransferase complex protein AlgI